MYLSLPQIVTSLGRLGNVHPFFGFAFFGFKKARIPIDETKALSYTFLQNEIMDAYFRPYPGFDRYFNPFKTTSRWVSDPFAVVDGMFEIQFPSLQITAGEQLLPADREVAESTINRLKLNDERCIRARQTYLLEFRDQQISFDYLARHAPFLAKELERQGIVNSLPQIMKSN